MKLIAFILLILITPFPFIGLIERFKSMWMGRKGPKISQPFWDILRLFRKGEVISSVTSFVFSVGASVYLASVITAALFVAPHPVWSVASFPGDFILFAYLLGFGRFFLILSAMDTGSSFEGMGASREITFATLVEPAFFVLLGTLALLTGQTSFSTIFAHLNTQPEGVLFIKIIGVPALFLMLLVEGSRGPVDDPATHLELTMIHEVMVLDHSGPNLAFVLYGSWLKMILIMQLIAGILIPPALPLEIQIACWAGVMFLGSFTTALVESLVARVRMSHNPQLIFGMTALALMAFASILYFIHGGV